MPTVETIRKLVQNNGRGVSAEDVRGAGNRAGRLCEVRVKEMQHATEWCVDRCSAMAYDSKSEATTSTHLWAQCPGRPGPFGKEPLWPGLQYWSLVCLRLSGHFS